MHYVIQENLFKERNYNIILNHLERMGLTYDCISMIPFTDEFKIRTELENGDSEFTDFVTERKDIFVFGSVKLAHIGARKGWNPGSMFNENHDFEVYSKHYKGHLLNEDVIYQKLKDPLPNLPTLFFARPCKDTKLFTGGVFMDHSWNEMVDMIITNNQHRSIEDEIVMFSTLKNITFETRCWVVDGKVITMSEYKRGNFVRTCNEDSNYELKERVQSLVDLYQPAKAFVMDVCELMETPGELKIVELNCINCAGFYDGDMQKVINALEETFN